MNVIKNTALIVITLVALTIAFNFKLMLMFAGNLGIAISILCAILAVITTIYLVARNIKLKKTNLV